VQSALFQALLLGLLQCASGAMMCGFRPERIDENRVESISALCILLSSKFYSCIGFFPETFNAQRLCFTCCRRDASYPMPSRCRRSHQVGNAETNHDSLLEV
jgi:hypothetical protein